MTTIISHEQTIPLTKSAIAKRGEKLASEILDSGSMTDLDAYIKLRALRDVINAAIAGLEPDAMHEAQGYSKDDRKRLGVGFRVSQGRARYDFSGDGRWGLIKSTELKIVKRRKAHEAFLKAIPEGSSVVDPDTGEYATPPEVTYSKSSLALTFPKE